MNDGGRGRPEPPSSLIVSKCVCYLKIQTSFQHGVKTCYTYTTHILCKLLISSMDSVRFFHERNISLCDKGTSDIPGSEKSRM